LAIVYTIVAIPRGEATTIDSKQHSLLRVPSLWFGPHIQRQAILTEFVTELRKGFQNLEPGSCDVCSTRFAADALAELVMAGQENPYFSVQ
jgi:hypothetical protein